MRAEMYQLHQEFQDTHWWFTARREIVLDQLRQALQRHGMQPPLRVIDVGCGAGGMVPHVREFGHAIGVDTSPEIVAYAQQCGYDVRVGSLPWNVRQPDEDPFDVVLLLDVLEHIDDDDAALRGIHAMLRPNGILLITVPALQLLWSDHDVVNEHRRRYSRAQLEQRLTHAGFTIDKISYFNTFLFPPIAAVRLAGRLLPRRKPVPDMVKVNNTVNRVFHTLFASERHLLSAFSLPIGVSLIAVARATHGEDVKT